MHSTNHEATIFERYLFDEYLHFLVLVHVPSADMEEVDFMTYVEARGFGFTFGELSFIYGLWFKSALVVLECSAKI